MIWAAGAIHGADAKVIISPIEDGTTNHALLLESDLVEFFAAFYHALYVVGADAVAALGAAVLVQPSCAHFRCHVRVPGVGDISMAPDDVES